MSKTSTEATAAEMQAPEAADSLKLDVRVKPIIPNGNLVAFASVTINDSFKVDGFRIYAFHAGRKRKLERCLLAGNGGFP